MNAAGLLLPPRSPHGPDVVLDDADIPNESDLIEALRIARDETLLLPERRHLVALALALLCANAEAEGATALVREIVRKEH